MNRISRYALALALGLSTVSTAAFAADQSRLVQTADAQYASPHGRGLGATMMPGPYRFQLEQGPYAQVGPYDRPSQYVGGL